MRKVCPADGVAFLKLQEFFIRPFSYTQHIQQSSNLQSVQCTVFSVQYTYTQCILCYPSVVCTIIVTHYICDQCKITNWLKQINFELYLYVFHSHRENVSQLRMLSVFLRMDFLLSIFCPSHFQFPVAPRKSLSLNISSYRKNMVYVRDIHERRIYIRSKRKSRSRSIQKMNRWIRCQIVNLLQTLIQKSVSI